MGNIIALTLTVIFLVGWILNVFKFAVDCDFASPYKCEAIRGVGIFVPFVGGVTGYIDIEDGKEDGFEG